MEQITFDKRFKKHSRILVCGSSNTGKSHIVNNIIRFKEELLESRVDLLLYFYLVKNENLFRELSDMVEEAKFYQGLECLGKVLKDHSDIAKERGILVVLEDVQLEAYRSEDVCLLMTALTHHLPLAATILTVQCPFQKRAPFQSIINRNVNYLIVSNSPRLRGSLLHFGRDAFPSEPKRILKAFDEATDPKHDVNHPYLIANLDSVESLGSFYSGVFPSETLRMHLID